MNLKDKTVVIDNKTYRYSKIVMLPTEDKNGLIQFGKSLRKSLSNLSQMVVNFKHLYFLSTDKICEGDWFIKDDLVVRCNEVTGNELGCIPDNEVFCNTQTYFDRRNCYKIIASTYSSLNLPKPSDSFLEVYINAFNKGEKIEECLVEYFDNGYEVDMEGVGGMDLGDTCWVEQFELKTTKGEITIRKVKDSWNRDEVAKKISDFAKNFAYENDLELKSSLDFTNKWISENL